MPSYEDIQIQMLVIRKERAPFRYSWRL